MEQEIYDYNSSLKRSTKYFDGDELAAKVFLDKYALRDNKQNLLEDTPEKMHIRIASELARIEKKKFKNPMSFEEILSYLQGFKRIVPQGSLMYGIGNPYQFVTLSNCFVKGTKILTKRGVFPIEEVKKDDIVVTRSGEENTVEQIHCSKVDCKTELFSFKCYRTPTVTCTSNHKFWSITKEQLEWGESLQWNEVNHLRKGDYIAIPNRKNKKSQEQILVYEIFKSCDLSDDRIKYTHKEKDGKFIVTSNWTNKNRQNSHKNHNSTNCVWNVDCNFARFLGLWYGDGCVFSSKGIKSKDINGRRTRGITFTFSSKQKEIIEFVSNYGEHLFGVKSDVNDNSKFDGTVQIVFHSFAVGKVFEELFGRGCSGKKIYKNIYGWSRDFVESLLSGVIESDGTVSSNGDVRVVMKNNHLIEGLYHIARSYNIPMGLVTSVNVKDNHKDYSRLDFPKDTHLINNIKKTYDDERIKLAIKRKPSTLFLLEKEGYTLVKIKDKKRESTEKYNFVYNLGIKNDHSYNVEGLICKNCFAIAPPLDSYSGILYTDQQMVQICKRRGGVGTDISNLRPDGTPTTNAARTSTGIISFMERYSNSIREVAQNGRRGAMLLSISVHHPEILKFTKAKKDLTKITGANISIRLTNEFLEAVKNDKDYEIRWPVDSKNPKISRMVNAKDVWRQIVENARDFGEPGLLFWNKIIEESPADCYAKYGFSTIGTNPCFRGDTLIAVADGRNAVSLKELAKEGIDIPVYSINPNDGKISIKLGRNPRKTGLNKQIIRVHFDNNSYIDVTHDHKFPLKTGETKKAKDLKYGDSLFKFIKRPEKIVKTNKKEYYRTYCNALNSKKDKIYEHRLIAKFMDPDKWKTLYNANKQDGWVKGGIVVHHKDYDGLNNNPNNLDIMTFLEHKEYHAKKDNSGENNGKYSGYTNEDIEQFAIILTKKLNRRFSKKDWFDFVKDKKIPKSFSSFRTNGWFKTVLDLAKWAASECNIDFMDEDPRLVKTLQKAIKQGYESRIYQKNVKILRSCEYCGETFEVNYDHREISFCSGSCSNYYTNERGTNEKRTNSINNTYREKSIKIKNDQVRLYSELVFSSSETPSLKQWENKCRQENVPFRLNTKYGFKNFTEIKELAADYNHKVTRIEYLQEKQDVYNITVDDNHTVGIITDIRKNKSGNKIFDGIFALQCGEVPLSPGDSCRLLLLNLFGYVTDPFTKNAKFDFEQFYKDTQVAQRFMDNVIDLELECIDRIIGKIENDPEPDNIKTAELSLWKEIHKVCETGRRTGTGTTGLGDTLAALGISYSSKKGIKKTEKIYKTLKLGCYRSSVEMAKELEPFKVWDYNLEKNNPFLLRIKEEDPELYKDMKKYGRRNISLLTSAPAGSCSILTRTSSGIEPIFKTKYKRRKKINPSDRNAKVDFVDQNGDSWEEFVVYHPKVKMWMDITGETDLTKSPWYGSCAEEIDWKKRIEIQSVAGKNIDHSISSTINLPEDTTVEQVAQIYESAWKAGLKGITIYRENSRTGVLIDNNSCASRESESINKQDAPKRPKILPCDIYHIVVKGEEYLTIVGLLSNEPYEIFALKNGQIPKSHKNGVLKKVKRGHYKLITSNGAEIENIMEESGEMEEAITRLVSSSLRHGADISFVVEQLEKTKSADFGSFEKAIARSLKKYIDDGKKVSGEECVECGNELIREQGCKSCKNCGWSACT